MYHQISNDIINFAINSHIIALEVIWFLIKQNKAENWLTAYNSQLEALPDVQSFYVTLLT